jgi:hypothetical protein
MSRKTNVRLNKKITALASVASMAGAVAMAASAQANTSRNGVLDPEEFGLYYSPGSSGLVYDTAGGQDGIGTESRLNLVRFPKNASIRVDNNTASYRNRSTWQLGRGLDRPQYLQLRVIPG